MKTGSHHSLKMRRLTTKRMKKLWKDPRYVAKRSKSVATSIERRFPRTDNIPIKFPRPLIRVGDCIGFLSVPGGPRSKLGWAKAKAQIRYQGEMWTSSRLSYHLNVRNVPRTTGKNAINSIICHHCDHPWCINPKHIYLGDHRTNSIDSYTRNPNHSIKIGKAILGIKRSEACKEKHRKIMMGNQYGKGNKGNRYAKGRHKRIKTLRGKGSENSGDTKIGSRSV